MPPSRRATVGDHERGHKRVAPEVHSRHLPSTPEPGGQDVTPDNDDADEINVVWSATYDANGKPDKEARSVIDGIFKAGIDNIKATEAKASGGKADDDDHKKK